MANALEQLLKQTELTAYRLSKLTGVSSQLISYQKRKQYNLNFAIKLANILKEKGLLKENIMLVECDMITKI
jgi:hypothetical protein